MGEVKPRDDSNPEDRNSIDKAERLWTTKIFTTTNQAYREAVGQVVQETLATTDEQTRLYLAPFVEESIRRFGHHMLNQQDRAITDVEQIVAEYRRRRRM